MNPEPEGSFTAHYLNAEDVEVQSVIHTYNPKKSSIEDDGTVDNAKDKDKNPANFKTKMEDAIDRLPITKELSMKFTGTDDVDKLRDLLKEEMESIFVLK